MGLGWERALLASWIFASLSFGGVAAFFAIAGGTIGAAVGALLLVGWVPLVAFLAWWHVRARRLGREALPPHRPLPTPVAPPDEDAAIEVSVVAKLDGPVSACPECGYLGIRAPGIRDGLWPGGGETGGRFVCPRCDWQGIPVEFEDGDAYAAFVRGLNAPA